MESGDTFIQLACMYPVLGEWRRLRQAATFRGMRYGVYCSRSVRNAQMEEQGLEVVTSVPDALPLMQVAPMLLYTVRYKGAVISLSH
jgi:hypothetical protein